MYRQNCDFGIFRETYAKIMNFCIAKGHKFVHYVWKKNGIFINCCSSALLKLFIVVVHGTMVPCTTTIIDYGTYGWVSGESEITRVFNLGRASSFIVMVIIFMGVWMSIYPMFFFLRTLNLTTCSISFPLKTETTWHHTHMYRSFLWSCTFWRPIK